MDRSNDGIGDGSRYQGHHRGDSRGPAVWAGRLRSADRARGPTERRGGGLGDCDGRQGRVGG